MLTQKLNKKGSHVPAFGLIFFVILLMAIYALPFNFSGNEKLILTVIMFIVLIVFLGFSMNVRQSR